MAFSGYGRGGQGSYGRTTTAHGSNPAAGGGGGGSYAQCGDGLSAPCKTMYNTAVQEKGDMQHLNDRLAGYIQKIRNMRADAASIDPAKYREAMQMLESEMCNLKNQYEAEIDKLRRQLEDCCKDRNGLAATKEQLCSMIADLQKQLEAALQGKASDKSLADKCSFDNLRKDQQIRDLSERLKAAGDIIGSLEGKINQLTQGDGGNAEDLLRKLRDGTAAEIKRQQQETEGALNKTLQTLKCQLDTDARDKDILASDKNALEQQLMGAKSKISDLEGRLTACCSENQALKDALAGERANSQQAIAGLEQKLRELQNQLMDKVKECNAARDMQVSLKAEIGSYQGLLDEEERRLGHSQRGPVPPATSRYANLCATQAPRPVAPCRPMTAASVLGQAGGGQRGGHGGSTGACCDSCRGGGPCDSTHQHRTPTTAKYGCSQFTTDPTKTDFHNTRVSLDFNPGSRARPGFTAAPGGYKTPYNSFNCSPSDGCRPPASASRGWQF